MLDRLSLLLLAVCTLALTACQTEVATVSNLPMIPVADHMKGPWQVFTLQGEKVTYYDKRVYITNKSALVLRNGDPVRTIQGYKVYLNRDNQLIDRNLRVIPFDHLLELDKNKPLPPGSSLVFPGFYEEQAS